MLARFYVAKLPTPTSTRNDRPAAFNNLTDISYSQQLSSCTSTTWPYQLLTSPIYLKTQILLSGTLHRACKNDNKLLSLLYLLPCLCFLHCLWLSLLAHFNLNHLRSRCAYRLRNRGKTPTKMGVLNYTWWLSSSSGALRSVEYPFIVITPWSILISIGSTH